MRKGETGKVHNFPCNDAQSNKEQMTLKSIDSMPIDFIQNIIIKYIKWFQSNLSHF